MNKKFVIKIFTTVSMILIGAIVILAIIIAVTSSDIAIRYFAIGLGSGALVGGILKCLVAIPKKYKDKDERALLVALIANLISQSVFGIASYLCLMLVLTDIITVDALGIKSVLIFALVIISLTFITDKIAYRVIDAKM